MPYEIAKLLLEHAGTFLDRTEAVKSAMRLGMPLSAIEEYLDWLDSVRSSQPKEEPPKSSNENPNAGSARGSSGTSPLCMRSTQIRSQRSRFFRRS